MEILVSIDRAHQELSNDTKLIYRIFMLGSYGQKTEKIPENGKQIEVLRFTLSFRLQIRNASKRHKPSACQCKGSGAMRMSGIDACGKVKIH